MTIHTNMTEPAPVRFQAGQNRITEIKKTNDTVTVAVYTYDALGRRIQVKDALASADAKYKRFYYDGQRVLLEKTLSPNTVTYALRFSLYAMSPCHDHALCRRATFWVNIYYSQSEASAFSASKIQPNAKPKILKLNT